MCVLLDAPKLGLGQFIFWRFIWALEFPLGRELSYPIGDVR